MDSRTKAIGFPVGSATLIDEVGIDVGAHIADYISGVFGSRFGFGSQETNLLKEMVSHGYLGTSVSYHVIHNSFSRNSGAIEYQQSLFVHFKLMRVVCLTLN